MDACVEANVSRLVFTSTVDVVIGADEIQDGDETLPYPDDFLFPGYPETKMKAEKFVLAADGTKLKKGEVHVYMYSCTLTFMSTICDL